MAGAGKSAGGKGAAKGAAGKGTGKASAKATTARKPAPPRGAPPVKGTGGKAPSVKPAAGKPTRPSEPPRLRTRYAADVRPALQRELDLPNIMLVPRMQKIVLNMGVGRATQQPSLLEGAVRDLTLISGQKPIITKAKKSIAGFKLRQGNAIGAKVTLRGDRMWEFFDRLISLAIPRIRDFRGLPSKGFDGRGNYTFGVTEQLIFPEIDYDKIDAPRGMDITIATTARTDREGRALLEAFGFPFRRDGAA
jgi:large subunit ribosomal protein L5